MPAKFELIAPCFFGCESTAKFELTRIGAENIRVEDGRLSFCGGAEMIAAANLNLRPVERVMLLLARYKATTFDELFDGVYAITADMDFELHYGKRANKRRKMYNGMIPCQLYMYYNAPKTEKVAKPMPKSGFDGKRTHFEKK